MSKINNSNYNKISVKTDSMVKMIEQLAKLGVFKEKRKTKSKSKTSVDEIKQDSNMVGYTKTLEPNLFALRQPTAGMTQQQLEDLQQRNAAGIAALRAEVQQQRLADIEEQQGQRFSDITRLGGIMNPILERFRGAQDPGAGQRTDPFSQSSTILLPDIQEETFTQTLNEGGPQAVPAIQTDVFPVEEEQGFTISETRKGLEPREKIGGGVNEPLMEEVVSELTSEKKPRKKSKSNDPYQIIADSFDFGPIPTATSNKSEVKDYYLNMINILGEDETVLKTKNDYIEEIKKLLLENSQNQ